MEQSLSNLIKPMTAPDINNSTKEERRAYVLEAWKCLNDCEACGKCRILRGRDPERLLQGTKRSTHEGGIRVPFIAWWPGEVEAGSVNDHQLIFYDLMPTFCDLAGIDNYVERYTNKDLEVDYFDGLSFAPTLTGEGEQEEHEFLYWEFHETNMMALRMGNWKLVVQNGNCRLYDLVTDLHEDNDLASQYPEIVNKMKEIIKREHTPSNISQFNNITLPR